MNSTRYIPRRFASRYTATIHLPLHWRDSCIIFLFLCQAWATVLDQRFTRLWLSGHWRTRRPWCPRVLHEPPTVMRLSHSHYLYLLLSARRGKFFTVWCVRLPAKFSRDYAPATTHKEGRDHNGEPYGMPCYQGPSGKHYCYSVQFDTHFSGWGKRYLVMAVTVSRRIHMQIEYGEPFCWRRRCL